MNKTTLLTGFAAMILTVLAGCSKQIEEPTASSSDALIELSGSVLQAESPQVKAPVGSDPSADVPALTLYFARADEASDNTYPDYATMAHEATRAAGKGAATARITWAPGQEQRYQASGRKTKLTAWYPGRATTDEEASGKGFYDGAAQRVTWKIDGQQDVMTAAALEGSSTSALRNVSFEHRLSQVQVYLYAEDAAAATAWGNTTGASVREQRSLCVYDLKADAATGAVTFKGTTTSDFEVYKNASGVAAPTTKATATLLGTAMIESHGADYTLKLSVVTAKGGTQIVSLATQAFEASKAYKVYLKLQQSTIATSATITDWATPVDKDMDVDGEGLVDVPAVGDYYYTDGSFSPKVEGGKTVNGLIYYVDPVDPGKFKVMALEQTAWGTSPKWAANYKYEIGPGARSRTDGRGNVAAIKAAFDNRMAGIVIIESTFATAFEAAAYCYNYTGKGSADPVGTWYLPAINDLQYLYCAFNGAAPVVWKAGRPNPSITDVPAQTKWNSLLTASGVGGTVVSSSGFWSSTEPIEDTENGYALLLDIFNDGFTTVGLKHNSDMYIRCVRDITPPLPAVGDYYFTDGSFSPKVENDKTVNGLVYYVDPANPSKFKVMALDESSTTTTPKPIWAAKNTYEIGSGAWSPTDGRGNAAAIKTAYNVKLAGVVITESTFGDAFPAAAYCYDYQGKNDSDPKGTWYLPAKNDLQYLYCAFNGAAPVIWTSGSGTSVAPVKDVPAQTKWNGLLTSVGGTGVTSGFFWSGTEDRSFTSGTWYVNFSNGFTLGYDKCLGIYVRCVRDL